MQVPGGVRFRGRHRTEPFLVELQQEAVVEDARGMHDAGERRHRRADLGHESGDVIEPGHVDGAYADLRLGRA